MKLIYLSVSWIAGVCVGMWAGFHWVTIVVITGIALLALALRRRRALLFTLCLIVLLGGIFRFQSTVTILDESSLQFYNDKGTVQVKGLVATDPELTEHSAALHLEAREINIGEAWRYVSGTVLVYVPRLSPPDSLSTQDSRNPPYYRYGDLLQVEGELVTPPQLDDFDWQEYLARKGIHSIISYPDRVEILASGQGSRPLEWLYLARNRMSQSLDSALHEPQASLAQAMLLGKRSTIPDELGESLAQTGTAHIIAISGLHLGIVGGIVLSLWVRLFGRRRITYFLLTIGIIWGYALLTGLHAPVLRAAIMVSLWLFADYVGRPRSALTSLLFAAALMIGIHPSILREVSFQMSFAAIAGVIVLTPLFQSWGRRACWIPEDGRGFRSFFIDSLSFTLGAVVTTLPVIALYFHQISVVALPANFCALPALPFAIITSALVAFVGLFAPPLAQVLGWVSWLFISYMIEVIEAFSALPFASLEIEVGTSFVWEYYAVLGIALWVVSNRLRFGTIVQGARARTSSVPSAVRKVPARFIVFPLIIAAAPDMDRCHHHP